MELGKAVKEVLNVAPIKGIIRREFENDFGNLIIELFEFNCVNFRVQQRPHIRKERLEKWRKIHGEAEADVLWRLWWHLSISSQQYVEEQVVSDEREQEMIEQTRRKLAKAFSLGLIDELAWVMSHAHDHAWHISFFYEAIMFGSLLDDGGLKARLYRSDIDD
ncbi:hypothetical protein QQS21_002045 [Conoideocrella luteorostrata]|uniref:Uncharacterized protein n=1 Tax=Conoideocrella luteorostrata TaxID=1105319 RepID=A0AAJ0G1L8_9HYPO|nr:hypothetical protein QQS21_002045 [Conoideocrella luteorostrata]